MYATRPLFGGTITCDINNDWRDVSDIRQVPDHQECFQEMEGALLVVEILERQDVTDENAASFFFNDLAESNGSSENQFQNTTLLSHTSPMTCCLSAGSGTQKVAMGRDTDIAGNPRQQDVRWVQIEICAFRLPNVGTDLLLTVSKPIEHPSAKSLSASDAFHRAVSTLQVRDWALFG